MSSLDRINKKTVDEEALTTFKCAELCMSIKKLHPFIRPDLLMWEVKPSTEVDIIDLLCLELLNRV